MKKIPSHKKDLQKEASAAHLRYVSDAIPGIRRLKKAAHAWGYVSPTGKKVHDAKTLKRIAALVLPPAWTDVWICIDPRGHLQATGRDKRGRKQYRYHRNFRAKRDQSKFHRLLAFGKRLPQIRRRAHRDLRRKNFSREKVLAAVVLLLEETLIRVGNESSVRENHSFGLTTLQNKHVAIHGASLVFHFRGKSGKTHTIGIQDLALARIVHQCQELPGQHLFEYRDEKGACHAIESADVNAYLHAIAGEEFTAKDYRTWMGTVFAAEYLTRQRPAKVQKQILRIIRETVCAAAEKLGNTPAVCHKYYIHPALLDAFRQGKLPKLPPQKHRAQHDLSTAELLILRILQNGF